MLHSCGSQHLPHPSRCIWLVSASDQQRNAPEKDINGQTVMPCFAPAGSRITSELYVCHAEAVIFSGPQPLNEHAGGAIN
jgi:hypothetical protein